MPSLIPGYEYDIFISYRQKDNKYDGWVTEFVANLKKELEATFKEDVSIYFDENPEDGILETHNVDKSLHAKLNCLVCIPILSQTYCDPKSFAWKNEFLVFRDLATADTFGLDIKLSNGNVVSRILPIRIHDLDAGDCESFEKETGDPLRPVDFIFKSPGVNRPLRATEDHPHDNLNKTYYRDQINKVANVVKGIISSISPAADQLKRNEVSPLRLKQNPARQSKSVIINAFKEFTTGSFVLTYDWRRTLATPLLLLLVALAVLSVWGWFGQNSNGPAQLATYSIIPIEPAARFIDQNPHFAIAKDGRVVAYQTEKGIYLQSLSNFSIKLLPDTEGAELLAFSPDQQSLAFYKDGGFYKAGIAGPPQSLISTGSIGGGMSWGIDQNIYFSGGLGSAGIWRVVSAGGGQPEQVTVVADSLGENAHTWPQLLPDHKTLLFTALGASGGHEDSRIVIENVESHERKVLVEKAISGKYLSNGNLIYATNNGSVFMVHFDLQSLRLEGQPVAILSGVTTGTWGGAAFLDVSETGNLVYLPRTKGPLYVLELVDRSGKLISGHPMAETILSGTVGHGWGTPELSPSGQHMAVTSRSYGTTDIWVLQENTGDAERITFDIAEDEFPVWSPDGNAIAFTSAETATTRRLLIKSLTSDASPRLIGTWPRHLHFSSWSPDGKWLAAYDFTATGGMDSWILSVDGKTSVPVANSRSNEYEVQFSPDGRWLVFQSDESGRYEIYAVAFPSLKNKRQVSTEGGTRPRWDASGRFIYYLQNGFMIAHPIKSGDQFTKGRPERLFHADASDFDISPDGKTFYLRKKNSAKDHQHLHLVTNWFEELSKDQKYP